jgi:hypothetical protein
VWFRIGARSLREHSGNRAFAWLLVALGVAYGAVPAIAPLARPFGFPVEPALQWAGLGLLASAAAAGAGLGWCSGGSGMRSDAKGENLR